jgi:hypothetical protein
MVLRPCRAKAGAGLLIRLTGLRSLERTKDRKKNKQDGLRCDRNYLLSSTNAKSDKLRSIRQLNFLG